MITFIFFALTAFADMPDMGIADGQTYAQAKAKAAKHGFKPAASNQKILNPVKDKQYPEVVCGKLKNNITSSDPKGTHDGCLAAFENKKEDFFHIELTRNTKGELIVTDF